MKWRDGLPDAAEGIGRAARALRAEARVIGQPEEGYWLVKLVKNGPRVPACIRRVETRVEPGEPANRMERSAFLAAFINGEPVAIDRVWEVRGEPISRQEHDYRVAVTDWAIKHAPDEPEAEPTKRIDLNALPPIYTKKAPARG